MNIYTVRKASQGLADYLNTEFEAPSIAVAYDSRKIHSALQKRRRKYLQKTAFGYFSIKN